MVRVHVREEVYLCSEIHAGIDLNGLLSKSELDVSKWFPSRGISSEFRIRMNILMGCWMLACAKDSNLTEKVQ
jgi:hypothetical protein